MVLVIVTASLLWGALAHCNQEVASSWRYLKRDQRVTSSMLLLLRPSHTPTPTHTGQLSRLLGGYSVGVSVSTFLSVSLGLANERKKGGD